ncbi:unnamed protein product, partial [Symbiodinium necroappetens]
MAMRGGPKFACMAPIKAALRSLGQAMYQTYAPKGVHVAHVVIDGVIESPNTKAWATKVMLQDPADLADAFFALHEQKPCVWSYEIQLTPCKESVGISKVFKRRRLEYYGRSSCDFDLCERCFSTSKKAYWRATQERSCCPAFTGMAVSRALLFASLVGVDATCVGDTCAPRTDGPWLLQQSSRRGQLQSTVQVNATPSELMPCLGGAVLTTACMTAAQYDDVVSAVRGHLESLPAICTATDCPQADWAGCVLRMAGHDFMDFANGQGGADACTDMTDADNGGLPACLANGEHGISLREVYQDFCTSVSLADFLVIAAEAVIMSTRARHETANPSAPRLDLRSSFRFGRTTAVTCDFAAGRLPNPENGCDAVEQTFLDGMGLDWTEAAALMGVHSLGRAQVSNSGYHGWWSDPENSRRFNNDYFVSLLAKGWIPELAVAGNAGKNQWERSDIGRDTSFDGHEMMLNSDLCLVYSENGRNGGPVLATEHDCCAWLTSDTIPGALSSNGGEYCGGNPGRGERGQCCGDQAGDCGDRNDPNGPAADAVLLFAGNEAAWLESFVRAWTIAIDNGHENLHALGQCPETTATVTTTTTTTTSTGSTQSVTTGAATTLGTTTVSTTSTPTPSTTSA